jgi:hypothetical protein
MCLRGRRGRPFAGRALGWLLALGGAMAADGQASYQLLPPYPSPTVNQTFTIGSLLTAPGYLSAFQTLSGPNTQACDVGIPPGLSNCLINANLQSMPVGPYVYVGNVQGLLLLDPLAGPQPFAADASILINVLQAVTQLSLKASDSTVGVGNPVTFTVQLKTVGNTPLFPVYPSGRVTLAVNSKDQGSCGGVPQQLTGLVICTLSALPVGEDAITAAFGGDFNFSKSSATGITVHVVQTPVISFAVPTHHTIDRPFTVTANSNSEGAFTCSVQSGPAKVVGNTVTLDGEAGTVTLVASEAANGDYTASSAQASFDVIAGSEWLGNADGTLSVFGSDGVPLLHVLGGGMGTISGPLSEALDSAGNMWTASANGVSEFTWKGVAMTRTAITAGGVLNPSSVAVDGAGLIWIANGDSTASVLNSSGQPVTTALTFAATGNGAAGGIAIDLSGNVWVTSPAADTVMEILGGASPVAPLATELTKGTTGERP